MMLSAAVIALLLQTPPVAVEQPVAPASISGVVVHNSTGEPIANVRVALARTDLVLKRLGQILASSIEGTLNSEGLIAMNEEAIRAPNVPPAVATVKELAALPLEDVHEVIVSVNGDSAVVFKSMPPIMTDAQGRFAFNNSVAPGTYRLMFSSNGFIRQDYGQRAAGAIGDRIVLGPGQVKNDVVMRLSQSSAVGGRVTDIEGQPIAGVPVQLFRFVYDETGERKVQFATSTPSAASTQTDDRGQYRIYFVSPGRYYLKVGNPPGRIGSIGPSPPPPGTEYLHANYVSELYAISYYPGVSDVSTATPIDVPAGADIRDMNMVVKVQQRMYSIRGTIVDPRTNQPLRGAGLNLLRLDNSAVATYDGGPLYNGTDATFELRNIGSGSYKLEAYISGLRAVASIDVVDSDVEGVQLRLGTASIMDGRVTWVQDAADATPDLFFMKVQLKRMDGAAQLSDLDFGRPKPDGTFRVTDMWPGEFRLVVTGLPSGFYLKEARYGDADALNGVRFLTADSRTLNLVISSKAGQIEGTASNSQGQPVPGTRVVLIPEGNRARTELFRAVNADPGGRFVIPAVAPGDYKLVAWDAIEPYAFFDPQLLKQADDIGKLIHVTESSQQSVNVVPISPGQ